MHELVHFRFHFVRGLEAQTHTWCSRLTHLCKFGLALWKSLTKWTGLSYASMAQRSRSTPIAFLFCWCSCSSKGFLNGELHLYILDVFFCTYNRVFQRRKFCFSEWPSRKMHGCIFLLASQGQCILLLASQGHCKVIWGVLCKMNENKVAKEWEYWYGQNWGEKWYQRKNVRLSLSNKQQCAAAHFWDEHCWECRGHTRGMLWRNSKSGKTCQRWLTQTCFRLEPAKVISVSAPKRNAIFGCYSCWVKWKFVELVAVWGDCKLFGPQSGGDRPYLSFKNKIIYPQ